MTRCWSSRVVQRYPIVVLLVWSLLNTARATQLTMHPLRTDWKRRGVDEISSGEVPVAAEDGHHEQVGKAMVINSQGDILAADDRISSSLSRKKPSTAPNKNKKLPEESPSRVLQKASTALNKTSMVRQAPVVAAPAVAIPAAPVASAPAAAAPAVPVAAAAAPATPLATVPAVAAPAAGAPGAAPAAVAPTAAVPAAAAPAAASPGLAAPAAAAGAPAAAAAPAVIAPKAAGAPAETAPAAEDASTSGSSSTVTYMFLIFIIIGIVGIAVAVYQQRKIPTNVGGRLGGTAAGSPDETAVAWRTSKARSTYRKAVLDKSDDAKQGTDDTEEDDATKKSKVPSGSDRETVGSTRGSTGGSASVPARSYRDRRLNK